MCPWTVCVLTLTIICLSFESAQTYALFNNNGVRMPPQSLPITLRAPHRLWLRCIVSNKREDCPVSLKYSISDKFSTSRTKEEGSLWDATKNNRGDNLRHLPKPTNPYLKRSYYTYYNLLTRPNLQTDLGHPSLRFSTSEYLRSSSYNSFTNPRKSVSGQYEIPLYSDNYDWKSMKDMKLKKIGVTSIINTVTSDDHKFSANAPLMEFSDVHQMFNEGFKEKKTADKSNFINNYYDMKPVINSKLNISNEISNSPHYNIKLNDKKLIETFTNEGHTTPLSILPEINDMEGTVHSILKTTPKYDVQLQENKQKGFGDHSIKVQKFDPNQRNASDNKQPLNYSKANNVMNQFIQNTTDNNIRKNNTREIENTTPALQEILDEQRRKELFHMFSDVLDKLERKFYATTFKKLTSISPEERQENGISFAQSGLFLSLVLMALSTEADEETKAEIDRTLDFNVTDMDKVELIKAVLSMLPQSSDDLKFRWASRLVLSASQNVTQEFRFGAASALHLDMEQLNGNESEEALAKSLNLRVEQDSGGAMHDTFDPDDVSGGVRGVSLTTLYVRGRWRAAPTVLNGTRAFRDATGSPPRSSRMIRLNDIMRYANLLDWHFHALEISYSTPGLTLLMLIPHEVSLRPLDERLRSTSLREITRRMVAMRVAATMPLYTLRMTLLLPSKLQTMGINKLISSNNDKDDGQLRLSHAVQRLMFWSEAGRNAFKDDGIEWDEPPELELVVDRPYLFFVRWHHLTLMCGNFVL